MERGRTSGNSGDGRQQWECSQGMNCTPENGHRAHLLPVFFTIVMRRVQPQESDNDACVLSCLGRVQLCVTPWTVARQAPLSMGFSRQESWSELPCLPPGGLLDPGMEPASLAGGFFTTSATWEAAQQSVSFDRPCLAL